MSKKRWRIIGVLVVVGIIAISAVVVLGPIQGSRVSSNVYGDAGPVEVVGVSAMLKPATTACTGPAGRSAKSARWPIECPSRTTLVQSGVPKTASGGHAMSGHAAGKKWQEAQDRVLLQEFRTATGKAAKSMEEAEKWLIGLSLAERDRVGRRMNDPEVVGRHLQTPRIH